MKVDGLQNPRYMRHSWKNSPVTVIFISVGALLTVAAVFGHLHLRNEHRYMIFALNHQVDEHSAKIATILSEARSNPPGQIEDAIFEELQNIPSTSLITRKMVSVGRSSGSWECVIDTSSFGLEARRIQQATVRGTKP